MAIDNSAALAVANLYNTIQERPKVQSDPTNIQGANDFQDMVKVQFNKFAQMKPEEILAHIKHKQSLSRVDATTASPASEIVGSVRNTLQRQELITRKSLINEASLVDVLTSTTEATNTLKTLVEVRNKFQEAADKVFNMQV